MSKEQVKAYLQSGKLVKDLANKATEAGYEVSEDDLEEVLGGIKIVAENENAFYFASPAGGDKEGCVLRSPAGENKEGCVLRSPAGENKEGAIFGSPAGENRMDGALHREADENAILG